MGGGRGEVSWGCAGVVSELGLCCAAQQGGRNVTLDGAGRCCAAGSIDACGVCGGTGDPFLFFCFLCCVLLLCT